MSDGLGGFGGDAAAADPDGGSTDDSGLSDYDPPDPDPPSGGGGSSGGGSSGGGSSRDDDDDGGGGLPPGYTRDAPAADPDGGSTDAPSNSGGATIRERAGGVVDTVRERVSGVTETVSSRVDRGVERAETVSAGIENRVDGIGDGIDGPSGFGGDAAAATSGGESTDRGASSSGPVDEFVTEQLDPRAETYRQEVAEPVGEASASLSPIAQVGDRAVSGTPISDSREEFVTAGVNAANPAGVLAGGIRGGQAVGSAAVRTAQGEGGEVAEDIQQGATRAAAGAVDAVQDDPVGSISTGAGAVAGGFLTGTAIARGARSGGRAVRAGDDFLGDTRAQTGGRQRSVTEQETIEVEETIGDEAQTGSRSIEDIPGVSVQQSSQQQAASELEEQIQRGLDDFETDTELSPLERADQRIPDPDEFADPATRQREVEALAQRLRGDLDAQATPQTTAAVSGQPAALFGQPTAFGAVGGVGALGATASGAPTEDAFAIGDAAASDPLSDTVTTTATDTTADSAGATATGLAVEQPLMSETATVGTQQTQATATQAAGTAQAQLTAPDTATLQDVTTAAPQLSAFGGPTQPRSLPRIDAEDGDESDLAFTPESETAEDVFGSGIASAEDFLGGDMRL